MGFIEAQGKYARWFYRPIRQGLHHELIHMLSVINCTTHYIYLLGSPNSESMLYQYASLSIASSHVCKRKLPNKVIPLWYPRYPRYPHKGYGFVGGNKFHTLTPTPHTPQQKPGGFQNPCHSLGVTMGPPMIFGSIILQSKWPHPIILTTFIRWPMHKLQQFTEWADVGFPELLDKLSH